MYSTAQFKVIIMNTHELWLSNKFSQRILCKGVLSLFISLQYNNSKTSFIIHIKSRFMYVYAWAQIRTYWIVQQHQWNKRLSTLILNARRLSCSFFKCQDVGAIH